MALFPIAEEEFFWSCFFFQYFFFFSWQLGLTGSFERGKKKALSSAYFVFLGLDSSVRGSLAVILYVYIFQKVLWNKRWPLKQRASKSQTIILDFRPALASALIVLCIISLKLVDAQFCCSILTLMEGLRLS